MVLPELPKQTAARLWLFVGLLWLLLITVLSLIPISGTGVNDKWSHLLTYLFLAVWFSLLLQQKQLAWLALGLLIFGIVIEALQSLTSYRSAELGDIAANATGILLGLPLYLLPLHARGRRLLTA